MPHFERIDFMERAGASPINSAHSLHPPRGDTNRPVFWRVEGSLLHLSAVRPVAFFTWNAQSFSERWARRGSVGLLALVRPFLYATNRVFATRMLHTSLRGVSQDRLDLLGEEYFHYVLKPRLRPQGVKKLKEWMEVHGQVVLVSQGLDHVMRPLAEHMGVERLLSNRLEFRDGLATGRLLEPVIPPRGALARLIGRRADGRVSSQWLCREFNIKGQPEILHRSIFPSQRLPVSRSRPLVLFDSQKTIARRSVRESLAGKHILLIGVTGFIGKVWLIHLLSDLPEVGRIYLLIRRQGPHTARSRFEKIVSESPAFDELYNRHGERLPQFLSDRIEIIEGDVSKPGLGIEPEVQARLRRKLDLIVNSSGLTDFNPDLREALATNVDAVVHLLDFLRQSGQAALLHLSTCYVAGARDGRVSEKLTPHYTPARSATFDAEQEWQALHELVQKTEAQAESPAVSEELRRLVIEKSAHGKMLSTSALENHVARHRSRWLRTHLTQAAIQRAKELGWPNTYTFSKSLAESLIASRGSDLPVAVVRPSIVETSLQQPFRGWNEGVNTSAPLSYLLGTYFRQLPSNERKCLDVIPVDLVCRGMTLIAAALINRCHERVYQLATSAVNPCDMRRSIELTGLAHRKHYRAQESFRHRLRLRFDTISVSKERYQNFSAPRQKAIIRALQRTVQPLPFLQSPLVRTERNLDRVEKIIELYEPFILQNDHVFEAENIELLSLALPPKEKETFGYDALSIDWWDYWINVHIPAQRKWSYPLIEGRPLEPRPERPFRLLSSTSPPFAGGETLQSQAQIR
ncbi:MAG: SDR family oxidoreductase [Acidobacteria bacterium]|nr:SDR family oxidoreductase [Acidobacteriota bacterium]